MIVTAGGTGTRMGADLPKQFLTLAGKPVLRMTVENFLAAEPGIKVVTVLPAEWISYWEEYCLAANFTVPQTMVPGGITRFHSVRNALSKVPDGALVAIHDGVRPLISPRLVRELFAQAAITGSAVPVLPSTDTLRRLTKAEGTLLEAAPSGKIVREEVFRVQTPQIFYSEEIKAAYSAPYDTSFTDDASVAESSGISVKYCPGEKFNIKLTTRDDLMLASALLSLRA